MEEKWKELERRIKNLLKAVENGEKEKAFLNSRIKELERKIESLQKENLTVKLLRERIKVLEEEKELVLGKSLEKLLGIS